MKPGLYTFEWDNKRRERLLIVLPRKKGKRQPVYLVQDIWDAAEFYVVKPTWVKSKTVTYTLLSEFDKERLA
jgi:hypothetical protein